MLGEELLLLVGDHFIGFADQIGRLPQAVRQSQALEFLGLRLVARGKQRLLEHAFDLRPIPTDHAEIVGRDDQHVRRSQVEGQLLRLAL